MDGHSYDDDAGDGMGSETKEEREIHKVFVFRTDTAPTAAAIRFVVSLVWQVRTNSIESVSAIHSMTPDTAYKLRDTAA